MNKPTKKNGKNSQKNGSESSSSYYYVQGQRVNVTPRPDLVAVQFDARISAERIADFGVGRSAELQPSEEFPAMQESNLRIYRVASVSPATRTALADMRSDTDVVQVGEVYTNEHQQPLVLTDEIICKFKPEMTSDEIERLNQEYGIETVEPLGFSENAFVLRVKPEATRSALSIANEMVEEGRAEYCYPNFIEHIGYRALAAEAREEISDDARHGIHPSDPMFPQQWHLENTGQVVAGVAGTPGADVKATMAWQITMGSPNIRLAVIDGGTDIAHNDLNTPGKVVDPIDLMVTPPDNNPVGGSHGTQVAGMAVATANNGVVGAGSAPNCRLIAIKAGDTLAQIVMARGFVYAADHGADVITCSLGPNGSPWTMTDALREAIDYATTYGRNGRGCAYFQAIDNQSTQGGGAPNPISGDQVSAYERSIAVSRTNNRDRHDGAAMGVELDLCAPGTNVTTITNTTPTNASTFATVPGTSFATPLAAGVGCLVLSVNPNLSWEEVRQVLLDSAEKIDAVANPYLPAPANRPPGARNDRYGYGRVDAHQAVIRARAGSPRDLYIRDTPTDVGTVPQPAHGFWDSPDIWVRNADDGGLAHQNTVRGQDNFLHARIHNRGSQNSLPCWVRFYIASYPGTEFRYPYDFKNDTTTNPGGGQPGNRRPAAQFPALGTYLIGEQRIQSVPGGGNVIARVRWPQSLIPPAANWHPCVLVEISPHDGPNATGQHVWENNNLGQKNLTIVNARRGELITFPFRFAHPLVEAKALSLEVHKLKAAPNLQVAVDVRNPQFLTQIASLSKIKLPLGRSLGDTDIDESAATALDELPSVRPFRVTFLEEARIAVSSDLSQEQAETVIFNFPRGSSVEIQRGSVTDLSDTEPFSTDDTAGARQTVPGFSVRPVNGLPVFAMNPMLKQAKLSIPLNRPGWQESDLKIQVPPTATKGDRYEFDVVQRNAQGQMIGGVRLQVNIID